MGLQMGRGNGGMISIRCLIGFSACGSNYQLIATDFLLQLSVTRALISFFE